MDELERLVAAQWDALYRLATLLAGSDAGADDLLQAALLKAVRSRAAVLRAERPAAYLRRIVATVAIDEAERRRRQAVGAPPTAIGTVDPIDVLDSRDELWPIIAALPPRQRAVVVLRYYEDLSEREIAAVLGCRPGTVKSQCAEALRNLRAALDARALAEGDGRAR